MQISSYAALKAGDDLSLCEIESAVLKSGEVLIKVYVCGLSHSDLHMIDNDWFCAHYPLVPGHEIVGEVEALGEGVKAFQIGDRVGLGWHANYCHECEFCLNDEQHLCMQASRTIIDQHGGFASHVLGHESALVKIPANLSSQAAAPLMSAGIAVFNPLLAFDISPVPMSPLLAAVAWGIWPSSFIRLGVAPSRYSPKTLAGKKKYRP